MRGGEELRSSLDFLLNILLGPLFPSSCVSCGTKVKVSEPLCEDCWENVGPAADEFCFACGCGGRDTHSYAERAKCRTESHRDCRGKAVFVAGKEILSLVHAFKYKGNGFLGDGMGKLMTLALRDVSFLRRESVLIPVPLHPVRRRERGFNQSEILANVAGKTFGLTVVCDALKRTKHARSQTALTPEERRRNVENSFSTAAPVLVEKRDIILVDDVVTTGATAMACAETLREAGAASVSVLSFLVA